MLMTRVKTDVATVDVILLADGMSAATQEGDLGMSRWQL
jgi:hypothetical protein